MSNVIEQLTRANEPIKKVHTSVRFTGEHAELLEQLALKFNVTPAMVITTIVKDKLENWSD